MTPRRTWLTELDQDVEAILGVPITREGFKHRRRRNGLLIAAPLALAIGAITVGLVNSDSPLTAIEGSARRNTLHEESRPFVKQDRAASVVETMATDTMRAGSQPSASTSVLSRPQTAPGAASGPSPKSRATDRHVRPVEIAARSEHGTAFEPAPEQSLSDSNASTLEKKDASETTSTERDSRLETIDAIRSLRLQ